jgi:hypothetical protein
LTFGNFKKYDQIIWKHVTDVRRTNVDRIGAIFPKTNGIATKNTNTGDGTSIKIPSKNLNRDVRRIKVD